MSAHIAGCGWVTPLGSDLDAVFDAVMRGDTAEVKQVANPETGRLHSSMPVPQQLVQSLARNPRLRRSSSISYFAVAAGLAALDQAGVSMTPAIAARTSLVFAISNGGVIYTRKFYDQIARQGANAASPLLFPETVYNAPASHLASQLGIDGASYTLVGDGSIGLVALHFAKQLLDTADIDQCVVVGAEECDWILCEAFAQWRLARTPLAEGAAALVLTRSTALKVETHPGATFLRRRDAQNALESVVRDLGQRGGPDMIIASANGTFIDEAEAGALSPYAEQIPRMFPKRSLGEAVGASALMQAVFAAVAVARGSAQRALVTSIGFNQQAGAAVIERVG